MTEIRDDHLEWAVVDRLRRLLKRKPLSAYNVTEAYAFFTTILCWTMQRVRTTGVSSAADEAAVSVRQKLENVKVGAAPWSLWTDSTDGTKPFNADELGLTAASAFSGHTAKRFLINLRDATAHGDARSVRPFHQPVANGVKRELIGFTFECLERDRKTRRTTWEGEVTLLEFDMRRIGIALADAFCSALRLSEGNKQDGNFEKDARAYVGEGAPSAKAKSLIQDDGPAPAGGAS